MMPGPRASESPTPRELKALKAITDLPWVKAAESIGVPPSELGSILSRLYRRLGITNYSTRQTTDRRRMAVNICKREGWWES